MNYYNGDIVTAFLKFNAKIIKDNDLSPSWGDKYLVTGEVKHDILLVATEELILTNLKHNGKPIKNIESYAISTGDIDGVVKFSDLHYADYIKQQLSGDLTLTNYGIIDVIVKKYDLLSCALESTSLKEGDYRVEKLQNNFIISPIPYMDIDKCPCSTPYKFALRPKKSKIIKRYVI